MSVCFVKNSIPFVSCRLNENSSIEDILREDNIILKLIDWGRGIDMDLLNNKIFQGKAGTTDFDCFEMKVIYFIYYDLI